MIRQGYSMKEKKAIVDFIVSKEAYGKVKGREVWIDFEKIGDIERTWQSAKEVFIKRILPEINNPYYKLSAEQIKFFRTGINQPVANTLDWMCKDNKNKLKPVGRTFVSKNVEKNSKKAVKAFELKNTNNLHVPNMFRPNHSSNSLKAMRMKRKMSHRTTSSTESSSSSQFSDDESSSYSSSSQSLKSHSYKPNGTVKDLVKTRKPIYAFYKGQLFPLYVAKSKVKHYRPDSTRPWHPASRRSRKSSQKRKSSNRCYPKYDNIVLSTDSDEDLTYYGKPEKRYKRHIENGNRKDLQSHRSSNEHKLITKVPSTPSPGCLPETKFNKKIQNTMQTRVDLDFPNDEIEMRYYKDLERFYDGGQVGQKPVKQWYQRVLTEDEKRKHKKYSHLYKTGPEISNVPKTPDSQAFWKIKYLMEKKNLNEVCKYMAEKTPTVTNSMDELNKINKRNSSISLNDKTPSAVQKKKTNGVSDKNEFEIIEGDNKTNTIVNPSDDCNLDKEKIIQKTSPKPKMSNCIIKYSKHGNDIINKSFPMNTQKEGLLFSVLKSLGKTETSESVTQPGASGKDNAVTDVACKMTDVKDVKVEEKLSIQEKEKKIFEEIEKEEEIVINSSGSGKRDIFTPLELSLLLNNSKSVCEKDTLEEVSEKKKSSDVIPKDDTSKEQESKTRIVKTNVNRSVEMRRSPRVKTQSIEGPSHSTPKRTSLKVEELNPDENFSHIQEAGESLPKQNNNDSDSKDSDGFFANTTFQFNPVYKDTSNQKTLKKVCSSTSSDSEAMYSFPKAPRTKWKISLKTKKSKSKKACDANLNSSKKRLSQPMKNVM